MANYNLAATDQGAYEKVPAAAVVDKVSFARIVDTLEVETGATAIYVRVDGVDPTVGDPRAIRVPAYTARVFRPTQYRGNVPAVNGGNTEVRVVSAGTPTYHVSEAV